jgi:hypothetical protein
VLKIITESDGAKFIVGGEVVPARIEVYVKNRRNVYDVYLKDQNEKKLLSAKLIEIPDNTAITFYREIDWANFFNKVKISIRKDLILYQLRIELDNWTEPFKMPDYIDKYIQILRHSKGLLFELKSADKISFSLYTKFSQTESKKRIIKDEIKEGLYILKENHQKTVSELLAMSNSSDVKTLFHFPEQVRPYCEQYLSYFVQFLRDLGINAVSNLKEEAGKVLFSVTPTDNVQALDKIREALAVYLNLPSSPIIYDESFPAMRLQQQIENLQHSQKMAVREIQLSETVIKLQSETIQEKNLIISQKDSIIEQLNRVIEKISSKSIMMDSLENKEELEKVYEGLKVGESEFLKKYLGIGLNPITVLKTVGKMFLGKEDERKSMLGLEEETDKEDN